MVVRGAGPDDTEAVLSLYEGAGDRIMGMSSIRPERAFLARRLEASLAAFGGPPPATPESRDYFFVLQEGDAIVATAAIFASVGLDEAFYSYRIGTTVHASRELGVYRSFQTLHLSNDYTGATEVASLFVHHAIAGRGAGRLVSISRMLYLAEHPERFDQRVIAEMRGFQAEDGASPFWEGLGRHFFAMPFPDADRLSAAGSKEFIAELMPRHPIYTHFLPPEAQAAIGEVHPWTRPARRLLESEGFAHQGYVDIFDGGPTLEGRLSELRPIRESTVVRIQAGPAPRAGAAVIVATRDPARFRAVIVEDYLLEGDTMTAPPAALALLDVVSGESVRVSPLRPGRAVL
jgi:arginine N-succinyltransferase